MTDLSMLPRPAAAGGAVPPGLTFAAGMPVADFTAVIKRITTTDESKLQLVLESAGLDAAAIAQVQRMLELQRGTVLLTLASAQSGLFDEVPPPQAS
ncbi:MAG: hypothetical protein C3F19_17205 [Rhodocyclales bacterium]|nr:MAG: hypothetical protein C3F19_17205 [Rhodocyclales bacterium]